MVKSRHGETGTVGLPAQWDVRHGGIFGTVGYLAQWDSDGVEFRQGETVSIEGAGLMKEDLVVTAAGSGADPENRAASETGTIRETGAQRGAHRRGAGVAGAGNSAPQATRKGEALTDLEPLSRALAGPFSEAQPRTELDALELDALRSRIFSEIRQGNFAPLVNLLPDYRTILEGVVAHRAPDSDALRRMEADHAAFFEQLKATLAMNRIQTRLELERIKASRQYMAPLPEEPTGGWQG